VLRTKAHEWKAVSMLARTHGQPASPTRLGKEIYVFVERLTVQKDQLNAIPFSAKFGGATGNFNAHAVAYPDIDWPAFADDLVNQVLGLSRAKVTTQIEHYDNLAAFCDNLRRINTILIDLDRDIWTYISMDYFKQKIKKGEVGSSVMPHKVNPIDFENSEGNLGVANAVFRAFGGQTADFKITARPDRLYGDAQRRGSHRTHPHRIEIPSKRIEQIDFECG
jgi:adenylosuccinate lyase